MPQSQLFSPQYFVPGPFGFIEKDYTKFDLMVPFRGESRHPNPSHWHEINWAARVRDLHRCVLCAKDDNIDVHHRTYKRWGRERLEDVYCLCRRHHIEFHGLNPEREAYETFIQCAHCFPEKHHDGVRRVLGLYFAFEEKSLDAEIEPEKRAKYIWVMGIVKQYILDLRLPEVSTVA